MADATYSTSIAADGTGTITIRPGGVESWIITQISVEMPDAPSGATCVIRKNGYLITPIIAAGDAATGDPPVVIFPYDQLTVEFAGSTEGAVGKTIIFYDQGRYI